MESVRSYLTGLECRACCTTVEADRPVGTCPTCGHTLFATYDLAGASSTFTRVGVQGRPGTLWRYRELLPVRTATNILTLGEGFTPILDLGELPSAPGVHCLLKDDGLMPTGSFKARGMAVAVSRARELGIARLFAPTAGNAGIALAAYAARGGLPATIYLPESAPEAVPRACRAYGAQVVAVPGTIREAGEEGRRREKGTGAFDMSTLREPYRVEGKKTMGFEIAEQLAGDAFPDAIVYPTGGGTGLVGMFKAFQELRTLGWVDRIPRLYAVQPDGCAPVVRALREEAPRVRAWEDPRTIAPGLAVPAPFASERILEAVRASGGGGTTVPDLAMVEAMELLAKGFGISTCPEGAAPAAALGSLLRERQIRAGETVLLYNTGSGATWDVRGLRDALGAAGKVAR